MNWTQKELEELYQAVQKAMTEDPAFREKAKKDARAAVEELAGRPLEEGFRLDFIEQGDTDGNTYVLPDFVGTEMNAAALNAIAGGTGEAFLGCTHKGECAVHIPCDSHQCFAEGCPSYEPVPCDVLASTNADGNGGVFGA